jgi:hypothetical protein
LSVTAVDALLAPDVPVTVTVALPVVAAALAVRVSVLLEVELVGEKLAVTPVGRPDAAKLTVPVNPLAPVTVMPSLPLVLCTSDTPLAVGLSVNEGAAVTVMDWVTEVAGA